MPDYNSAYTGAQIDAAISKVGGIEVGATADQTGAEIKAAYEAEANTNAYTDAEKTKLAGVETGAEVNNISDVNVTDLTDAGDSTLHYHASDRNRANHTGTQLAATISDFDTEVSNNTNVASNTTNNHLPAVLGTKTVDETDIAGGKVLAYNAISGNIEYEDPVSGGGGDMFKATYDPQTIVGDAFARANHTGTQSADTITDGTTNKAYTATEKTKLAGVETGAEVNNISDVNATDLTDAGDSTLHYHASDRNRTNHTGTQSADSITDGTTNKAYTATEKTKLAGIETGAEVNNISDVNATDLTDAGDSTLHFHSNDRNRTNHTGTQSADTIVDGTTNKAYTATEKTKLAGIDTGAEVNTIDSDPTGITGADQVTNMMSLTQAEYDAIGTPNASTLYFIT